MQSPTHNPDDESKARQGRRKGRRESYTRFSPSEQQNLLDGVARYGAGNWKKILSSYSFHSKRTAVDLKDKYRNILRAQERARTANTKSVQLPPTSSPTTRHHLNPVHIRGATSSSSQQKHPFPLRTDVPAPTEPPISSSSRYHRHRHNPLHHRTPSNLAPVSISTSPRGNQSPIRRTSGQQSSSGNGSHKSSTSSSSMPVAALLTAPDVSY